MEERNDQLKKDLSHEAAVEARGLRVVIDGHEVLKNITCDIARRSITMIVGPNGSGKTTLIRALMGLQRIEDGTVRLFEKKPTEMRERIGYVPQRFFVDVGFPITLEEFLSLTASPHIGRGIDRVLEEVGMSRSRKKQLSSLSGGQLQRVLIARALLGKPLILFLDEPVSNIDIVGSKSIYEHLDYLRKRYDLTVVIVSHEMDVVSRFADHVLCVNKTLQCAGTPDEVMTHAHMRELYGDELKHFHHHS